MLTQDRLTSPTNGDGVATALPLQPLDFTVAAGRTDANRWRSPRAPYAALSVIAVSAWVFVFTAGVTIASKPYRDLIENGKSALELGMALLATLLTFTPPNVAILCCISGVIGEQTRLLSRRPGEKPAALWGARRGPLTSALLRGFCVFIAILAGVLVLSGSQLITPTQDQYVRLGRSSWHNC